MKVRYTSRALRHRWPIYSTEARSPQGAANVKERLRAVIDLVADHPEAGRVTNKGPLRRVVVSPYPYVVFYQSDPTGIVIHGVRHSARRALQAVRAGRANGLPLCYNITYLNVPFPRPPPRARP